MIPVLALLVFAAGQIEIGVSLTGTHLHKIDDAPVGIGARFLFHFNEHAAADAELNTYSHQAAVLAGLKSGVRLARFGVFGKTRAGLWHFRGDFFSLRLRRPTVPAADFGGVLEYYPSPRTAIRLDIGDTVLFYGSQSLGGITGRLGTVHNFQPGIGFSFRLR
jgi:hypothetical protein